MTTWFPRSRGSQIYLAVLVAIAVAMLLVVTGHWRPGLTVMGGAFVAAAISRAVTPGDHDGMLRVRGRIFDVVWTLGLGIGLIVLSIVVPPGPGQ